MRIPRGRYIIETTLDTGPLAGIVKDRQAVVIKPPSSGRISTSFMAGVVLIAVVGGLLWILRVVLHTDGVVS